MASPESRELAAFLRDHREPLLLEWNRLHPANAPARARSLQALLEPLLHLLDPETPEPAGAERPTEPLGPEEVVAESLLLRKCLLRLLRNAPRPLSAAQQERLHEALDEALLQAVAAYTRTTQAALERSGETARRHAERTERLQAVTAALSAAATPAEVVDVLVRQGVAALSAQSGVLCLLSEEEQWFEVAGAIGYPQQLITPWQRFPADTPVMFREAVRTGRPILYGALEGFLRDYPHLAAAPTVTGNQAFAAVPLNSKGRVLGALGLSFARPQSFSDEDQRLMVALADQGAQALERAQLSEEQRSSRAFYIDAGRVLSESLDLETTLKNIARLAVSHLADFCTLDLLDENGELRRLEAYAKDPVKDAIIQKSMAYPPLVGGDTPMARILRSGKPQLEYMTPEWLDRAARDAEHRAILEAIAPTAAAFVPLRARGRTLGILNLGWTRSHPLPTGKDLLTAQSVADRAAVALDNARLYTEAQAARAQAEEMLALLNSFFTASPIGFAVVDSHLRYLRVNQVAAANLGRTPEQVVGMLLHEVHTPAVVNVLERLLRGVLETGQPVVNFELRSPPRGPSPEARHFLVSYYPVRFGPQVTGVSAVIVDISERKRAEERLRLSEEQFRTIFEMAVVGMAQADPATGRVVRANARLGDILGCRPEELVGRPFQEWTHPEDLEEDTRRFQQLARGELPVYDIEKRYVRKDGQIIWLHVTSTLLPSLAGEPPRTIAIVKDVTLRKRAEQELQRTGTFREQFIGILGHDLRGPLSAVKLSSDLLLRSDLPDEARLRSVQRIVSSTERMLRMIDDLLDFARGRLGGGIPVERRPANLHEIARHAVEELSAAHPQRALEFHAEGSGEGEFDADRMAQVVSNLVGNALQHGQKEMPVRVTTRVEGEQVVLEVWNQGSPLPPELLPSLFEPFRQVKRGKSAGLGLGLYIVSEVVKAHGGTVEARSTAAEGTTFTVRLPRTRAG